MFTYKIIYLFVRLLFRIILIFRYIQVRYLLLHHVYFYLNKFVSRERKFGCWPRMSNNFNYKSYLG